MNNKVQSRVRRSNKTRANIRRLNKTRLCVHRSNSHIYAQLTTPCGSRVLAVASSLEKDIREQFKSFGNKPAAQIVGRLIAERGLSAGVKEVAFDRGGYKYHGRVKALAESAREAGLLF